MGKAPLSSPATSTTDLPWAWPVALASSWIAFCNTGIYRSSAVLYVQIVHVFGSTREQASWPFSLFGAVSCFSGILPSLLVRWMTIRQIVLLGSVISVIGVAACTFANSVFWIGIAFGMISGFGSGLIMTLLPVILNQYFVVNRATASGIFLSGSTLSLLVLPSLTELLLDNYSLHGTFLMLAGVVMNIFVGALLLRPVHQTPKTGLLYHGNMKDPEQNKSTKQVSLWHRVFERILEHGTLFHEAARLLCNPMFILITFCALITRNVLVTFSLVLVDYVIDKRLTESQGVLLVSAVALPELLGRLCSGWISDHGYVQRKHVFLVSQLLSGAILSLISLTHVTWLLFILCALFALANGASFILINIFYLEYLGMDRLHIALSLKNVFMGVSSLLRPLIIGLFRDQINSYDYMFHFFAGVTAVSGAIWWLEPLLFKQTNLNIQDSVAKT